MLNINNFSKKLLFSESTDFVIDLPETIKNVTSLTLVNTEIPNNLYTFNGKNGTNEFTIETYERDSNGTGAIDVSKNYIIRIKKGIIHLKNYAII